MKGLLLPHQEEEAAQGPEGDCIAPGTGRLLGRTVPQPHVPGSHSKGPQTAGPGPGLGGQGAGLKAACVGNGPDTAPLVGQRFENVGCKGARPGGSAAGALGLGPEGVVQNLGCSLVCQGHMGPPLCAAG